MCARRRGIQGRQLAAAAAGYTAGAKQPTDSAMTASFTCDSKVATADSSRQSDRSRLVPRSPLADVRCMRPSRSWRVAQLWEASSVSSPPHPGSSVPRGGFLSESVPAGPPRRWSGPSCGPAGSGSPAPDTRPSDPADTRPIVTNYFRALPGAGLTCHRRSSFRSTFGRWRFSAPLCDTVSRSRTSSTR